MVERGGGKPPFVVAAYDFEIPSCQPQRIELPAGQKGLLGMAASMDEETPSAQSARLVLHLDSDEVCGPSGMERVEEWLAELKKLAADNEDDVVITWLAAVEHSQWLHDDEGIELCEQILKKWKPGPSWIHRIYADSLDRKSRHDVALEERKIALELEPTTAQRYGELGGTLSRMQRWREANAAYGKSVQLAPKDCSLLCDWAESLRSEKKFADAVKKCKLSLAAQPPQTRAWLIWAQILEDQDKAAAALVKYKKALAQNPDDPEIKKEVFRLEEKLKE